MAWVGFPPNPAQAGVSASIVTHFAALLAKQGDASYQSDKRYQDDQQTFRAWAIGDFVFNRRDILRELREVGTTFIHQMVIEIALDRARVEWPLVRVFLQELQNNLVEPCGAVDPQFS